MAKFDIKDKAFRNLIEERCKFYGLPDEVIRLNNAVNKYKKSNFFAKLFNFGDAKKAQKEFEELKADKNFKKVLESNGFKFDSKGDMQKAEWYANQTMQGVPDGAILKLPNPNQLSRSDEGSIGQYAQVPSQNQQYVVPNIYSSAALNTATTPVQQQFGSQFPDPQRPQQTPQPQPQPQNTRADLPKLFDVVRNNDVEALKEIIRANTSYVNMARDKDGYSPLHFAPNKQIAEELVKAGADINAVAKDGTRPVDWAQNNPDLKQYLDAQGRQSQIQSNNAQNAQVSSPPQLKRSDNVQRIPSTDELARMAQQDLPQQPYSFKKPAANPSQTYAAGAMPPMGQYGATPEENKPAFDLDPRHLAPRPTTQVQSEVRGIYAGQSSDTSSRSSTQYDSTTSPFRNGSNGDIYAVPDKKDEQYGSLTLSEKPKTGPDADSTNPKAPLPQQVGGLDKFGNLQGGIYGGSGALSTEAAEANRRAYEAEIAQQRAATTLPTSHAKTNLAHSAPPALTGAKVSPAIAAMAQAISGGQIHTTPPKTQSTVPPRADGAPQPHRDAYQPLAKVHPRVNPSQSTVEVKFKTPQR